MSDVNKPVEAAMNQSEVKKGTKSSLLFWLLVLLAVLMTGPLLVLVMMATLYLMSESRDVRQVQVTPGVAYPVGTIPVMEVFPNAEASAGSSQSTADAKNRPHVVRIQVQFADFETRYVNALVVDHEGVTTQLLAPSEVFSPVTGKVNGRVVTRQPSGLIVVESDQGPMGMGPMGSSMAMPGMGGSAGGYGGTPVGNQPLRIVREISALGLIVLSTDWNLSPIRILGDFPTAAIGDKLTVVSRHQPANARTELTLLGIDESVTLAGGQKLQHLLKLTEWAGESGALICNSRGEPIGQVVLASFSQGSSKLCYAVPLDRAFQAFYEPPPADSAIPDPGLDYRSSLADSPAGFPALGGEVPGPGDPFHRPAVISTLPPDPATPPANLIPTPAPENRSADALVPDLSKPELPQTGEMRMYRVQGFPSNVAETIRALFGEVAKVAVDGTSQSVIVIASNATQDRVAATITEMNDRSTALAEERRIAAENEKARQQKEAEENQQLFNLAMKESAVKDAANLEAHRNEPRRTRTVKVAGRDPQDVAKILTSLFGKKADVAIDEGSNTVLITINRAETWAEVQFLLAEIEATANKLMASRAEGSQAIPLPIGAMTEAAIETERVLDQEARQVAQKYRSATPDEQARLRKVLEQITAKHFDLRQTQRKQEIDGLSERIEKLRATQTRRQQNKSDVIQRRIKDLLDANADLGWDQAKAGRVSDQVDVAVVPRTGSAPNENTGSTLTDASTIGPPGTTATLTTPESTFDGVAYSQWLVMLETERKPEKLSTAMDATSRLAIESDHARIARNIFLAAHLFEAADASERSQVWTAGWRALNRLKPVVVVDQLVAVLQEGSAFQRGREFQMQYITDKRSAQVIEQLDARSREMIGELIKIAAPKNKDTTWVVAAACSIWGRSEIPLSESDDLQSLALQVIDEGPTVKHLPSQVFIGPEWLHVASAIVKRNPELPGLASRFMKHVDTSENLKIRTVLRLIGDLGPRAEPVVPQIVDRFVLEWNKFEAERDTSRSLSRDHEGHWIRCELIETLGRIGVGERSAVLLQELQLLPPKRLDVPAVAPSLGEVVKLALAKLTPVADLEAAPLLLSDQVIINGYWKLDSLSPGPAVFDLFSRINLPYVGLYRVDPDGNETYPMKLGNQLPFNRFELAPGKFSCHYVAPDRSGNGKETAGSRREGLYKLTHNTLRIQLAPHGQPPPKELARDKDSLPEGHVLLEYTRRPEPPETR